MATDADGSSMPTDHATEDSADESFTTPPDTDTDDLQQSRLMETQTLQDGTTYVLQSVSCGRMLTLLNGEVVLEGGDSLGSPYWKCLKTDKWYGFQNAASGKFLRHGGVVSGLYCTNNQHHRWENIEVRPHETSDKAFMLLMEHWGEMKPVGVTMQQGKEKLDRLIKPSESIAWVFHEVPEKTKQ